MSSGDGKGGCDGGACTWWVKFIDSLTVFAFFVWVDACFVGFPVSLASRVMIGSFTAGSGIAFF